jgi:choline dehydrogenase
LFHALVPYVKVLSRVLKFSHNSDHKANHQWLHDAQKRPNNSSYADNATEYDYVVVGSGSGDGPLPARLAIAGYKVLLLDAGDDQGNAMKFQVPALQLQSTEYEPMGWDYFVNHYFSLTRQEDSKMTYRTSSGDLHVGPSPPANSEPLGILYPRAGTLGGCSAHNAMMLVSRFSNAYHKSYLLVY